MRIYKGRRTVIYQSMFRTIFDDKNKRRYCLVTVNDKPLSSVVINPENDPKDTGKIYDWAYFGFFPYNLAYSILKDYFTNEPDFGEGFVVRHSIILDFLRTVVTKLDPASWTMTDEDVTNYLYNYLERK